MQKQSPVSTQPVHTDTLTARVLPTLNASDLLQGQREIAIRHEGQAYRLRLTRQNKLILTK